MADAGHKRPAGRSASQGLLNLEAPITLQDVKSEGLWPAVARGGEKAWVKQVMLQPLQGKPPLPPTAPNAGKAFSPSARRPPSRSAQDEAPPASAAPPGRPRTAGSRNRPPLGSEISFPAGLRLRSASERATSSTLFAPRGESLVLPLDTQHAIRALAGKCGEGRQFVKETSPLTVWVLVDEETNFLGTSTSSGAQADLTASKHILEPLTARKVDRSLAVEPIEMVVEPQTSRDDCESFVVDDAPDASIAANERLALKYGEGFRLRAAGCRGLYLSHGGSEGGLQWVMRDPAAAAGDGTPSSCRFAAHGGELGASLLMGRPMALQPIISPPNSPEESEVSDFDSDSDLSDSDSVDGRPRRRQGWKQGQSRNDKKQQHEKASSTKPPTTKSGEGGGGLVSSLLREANSYQTEGLFSRAGDGSGAFPVTFLPLLA